MTYKLTVILPVYNVNNYLDRALESIRAQTIGFENIEVIFVDDKSTDNSDEKIKLYANEYDNVKSYYLEENSGYAGKPRNVGLKHATSDYIMFLDPDDTYNPESCEILYNIIVDEDVDIVSGNYMFVGRTFNEIKSWDFLELENNRIRVERLRDNPNLLRVPPSVWAKIYRKEFLEDNDIQFLENKPSEDLYFVYYCLIKAEGIVYINRPVLNYIKRDDDESITSQLSADNLRYYLDVYNLVGDILDNYDESYHWAIANHLDNWSKRFIKSDVSSSDRTDLINEFLLLFNRFRDSKDVIPEPIKLYMNEAGDSIVNITKYENNVINNLIDENKELSDEITKLKNELSNLHESYRKLQDEMISKNNLIISKNKALNDINDDKK